MDTAERLLADEPFQGLDAESELAKRQRTFFRHGAVAEALER